MEVCKFGKEKTITEALKMGRRSIEGAVEAVWASLGCSTCDPAATRVWLACQGQGKR